MNDTPPQSTDRSDESPETSSGGAARLIRRRFLVGVGFGLLVTTVFVIFNDGQKVLQSLHTFDWRLIPLILLLSLSNYLLRFVKWHLYLGWVNAGPISRTTSFIIFMSGLAMAITPGKVGEFLKPYLVRRVSQTPLSVTVPVVVSERITDGMAVLGLASVGLLQVRHGWVLLLIMASAFVAFALLSQRRTLVHGVLGRIAHIGIIGPRLSTLETLYQSTWSMFRPRRLLIALAISLASWAGECLAFYLVLYGLGFPASSHLLFVATSTLAIATLIGAISLLPGGLGAAELSATGLLLLFIGSARMDHETAATATLLIRFATFWFGIVLGLVALLGSEWYLTRVIRATHQPDAA